MSESLLYQQDHSLQSLRNQLAHYDLLEWPYRQELQVSVVGGPETHRAEPDDRGPRCSAPEQIVGCFRWCRMRPLAVTGRIARALADSGRRAGLDRGGRMAPSRTTPMRERCKVNAKARQASHPRRTEIRPRTRPHRNDQHPWLTAPPRATTKKGLHTHAMSGGIGVGSGKTSRTREGYWTDRPSSFICTFPFRERILPWSQYHPSTLRGARRPPSTMLTKRRSATCGSEASPTRDLSDLRVGEGGLTICFALRSGMESLDAGWLVHRGHHDRATSARTYGM